MSQKRSSFTLLELLIALPLIALLLSFFLFSIQTIRTHQQIQNAQLQEIKEAYYFKYRLRKLLHSVPKNKRALQVSEKRLSFKAHNGIHPHPSYSNHVFANLIFKKGHLSLFVTKDEQMEVHIREENYFKGIEDVEFLWGSLKDHQWSYTKVDPHSTACSLLIKIKKKEKNKLKEEAFLFAL